MKISAYESFIEFSLVAGDTNPSLIFPLLHDLRDQILLKNSKCLESLQIEQERRPHRHDPNATCLGSNEHREREISCSVQNDKQEKKRDADCTVRTVRMDVDVVGRTTHGRGRTTRGR
jgi:hypothetical protein